MLADPDRYLTEFAQAGADGLIVPLEACRHLSRTLQSVRELGVRRGVAINPATPLVMLDDILAELDGVLLMAVEPGFGGQEFIPSSLERIAGARAALGRRGLGHVELAVDGGVHTRTIGTIARAGATVAVAGSAVFNRQGSVAENLTALRRAACDSG